MSQVFRAARLRPTSPRPTSLGDGQLLLSALSLSLLHSTSAWVLSGGDFPGAVRGLPRLRHGACPAERVRSSPELFEVRRCCVTGATPPPTEPTRWTAGTIFWAVHESWSAYPPQSLHATDLARHAHARALKEAR